MDTETLEQKVAEIGFWYHRIELPGGVVTPGVNPLDPARYRVPEDLTGKRVLDVGAWDGFWTFEALRRGAREVVAIDDFSDHIEGFKSTASDSWKSFDMCREALGYSEDRCKRIDMTIYDVSEERLGGRFDMVFFFGTIYHLRYPLLGMDKLASVCDGQIIVESQTCDDFSAYRGLGRGYPGEQMVAEFFPGRECAGCGTNWWAPSVRCLAALVHAGGFTDRVTCWKLMENPGRVGFCRGFASGFKPGAT